VRTTIIPVFRIVLLLSEEQTARKLRCSIRQLRKWRQSRKGPTFVQLGRWVKYPHSELEEFIRSRANQSEVSASH
jgi:hypothetical protein